MKKIYSLLFVSVMLTACAGNPPAWWNPRNLQPGQQTATSQQGTPARQASQAEQDPQAEQTISLQDESFEEMALTPLQDEEQENATGESASQVTEETPEDGLIPSILNE